MKRGASTSTSTTVTATDNSSALTSTSWALNFDANTAGSPAVVKLLMIGPVAPSQTIIPGGKNGLCNNFVIEYLDAWGALTTSYSSGIKLNSSSGSSADLAGVDLWPDYNSCQSGTTPASYIAQGINGNIGLYFGSVDYRGSSGVFQSSVTLFSGLTSSGLSPTNGTVSVQVPSTLSTLAVGMQDESNGTANITTSVCTPVFIDLYDSSGNATTSGASATEQITLSSSSSSLKLWYASNCTGTNASSVSIQADQFYANPLYVQSSAPGSYTISATAPNGATGSLNVTSTVSAAGVATTHLVMALQGQTFISGIGVTGYATEVEAGTALTATVYALTASNTIDTTNTNTVNFTTTSGSASFGSASAALSSGTATVSVTINGSGATLQATDSLSHTASDTITAAPAGQVPVQASVYGILPQSTALSDVCNAMMITSENQNGIAVQVSAQQSVYFQSTNLNVYLDSSCTSQISNAAGAGSTVIPAGQTATAVYVKAASGASTGANASFSLANGGNLPPSGSAYTTSATLSSSGTYSSTANYKIQKFGPPNILRNACSPVLFVGLTDLSVSYPFGTDTINSNTPNCSTGNPVAPAYYTDPACTSPAGGSSTVVFSGSSARAAIFYMQIGTGSGAATACSFSDSLNPSQFNIGTVPGFTFSVQTSY
jgi:hypothetical protein